MSNVPSFANVTKNGMLLLVNRLPIDVNQTEYGVKEIQQVRQKAKASGLYHLINRYAFKLEKL